MTVSCFRKQLSDPPMCGIHDVRLILSKVPIDRNAPGLGEITCFRCPVTQAVALTENRAKDQSQTDTRVPTEVAKFRVRSFRLKVTEWFSNLEVRHFGEPILCAA